MKHLQEHLEENLSIINEGYKGLKIYCVGRGEGPVVICKELPTTDPFDSEAEPGTFDITSTDWLFNDVADGSGNLAIASWDDESIWACVLDKIKNEKDLRKEFDIAVAAYIEENGDILEDVYIELPCGATVDMGGDGSTFTVDSLWNDWMTQFNESYVDCDSSCCRCLVDLKKKKVIAGGSDIDFDI